MSANSFARILNDNIHVAYFLKNTLLLDEDPEFENEKEFDKIIQKIAGAEMHLLNISGHDTLRHKEHRSPTYLDDSKRRKLRNDIYKELIKNKRPENDDDLYLGYGGALPNSEPQQNKQAFFLIGLPASGKSEIANKLADKYGAIILDSDYAKRKLPEYDKNCDYCASLVHNESAVIVFGGDKEFAKENSVIEYAVSNGYNIIIPRIGDKKEKIKDLAKELKEHGYENHLILIRLDREKATLRALKRFVKSGRYVSLPMIFDVYSNNPTIVFYDLQREGDVFVDYSMISSDVPKGSPQELVFSTNEDIVNFERSAY